METFNLACEYIIWHNFGNEEVVILGRDMLMFFMGYLSCFIIRCMVVIFKKENKNARNKKS